MISHIEQLLDLVLIFNENEQLETDFSFEEIKGIVYSLEYNKAD
jgi:hypothetical protein